MTKFLEGFRPDLNLLVDLATNGSLVIVEFTDPNGERRAVVCGHDTVKKRFYPIAVMLSQEEMRQLKAVKADESTH